MTVKKTTIKKNLLILGAGQYGQVLKEIVSDSGDYCEIAFLDDGLSENVIGKLSDYKLFADRFTDAVVAIGNPEVRLLWLQRLGKVYKTPAIVHPTAYVSPSAKIGLGTIVEPYAIIHTQVCIGRGCIISAGAVINHNSTLAEGVHCDCGCVIPARANIEGMRKIVQGEIPLR